MDISIHALLAESDLAAVIGGRTNNISIHALLAESDGNLLLSMMMARFKISIHALLAESDIGPVSFFNTFFKISIHALLAESDDAETNAAADAQEFLSTLSLRRATALGVCYRPYCGISIHALLAESDGLCHCLAPPRNISIHALLAESDP